jgi:glycosyltransferase involved in cell wall biosynthesis
MPAHNAVKTIERALSSVTAQRLLPGTVIVTDDGSSDATGDVARRLGATVLRVDRPRGAGAARNIGLRAADTSYCAFLDADDAWGPRHLETLRAATISHPDAALWLSGSVRETAPGTYAGEVRASEQSRAVTVLELLTRVAKPTTSASLVRRDVALAAGGFPEHEDYRPSSCEDLDLWLRLAEHSQVWALSTVTARYAVSDAKRDSARLAANERARIRTVERAIHAADLDDDQTQQVWAATWLDLGKWYLKHGRGRDARDRFLRCWRARPRDIASLPWVLLALLPHTVHHALRQAARRGRRVHAVPERG